MTIRLGPVFSSAITRAGHYLMDSVSDSVRQQDGEAPSRPNEPSPRAIRQCFWAF